MLPTTDNVESIGSSFVFHPPNSTRPGSVMRQMSNLKLATASITFQIGFSIFTPKIHTSGKSIYKISARFAVHHHDGWAQILFLFLFISSHCSLPCSLVAFIFAFLPQGRQLSAPFVCVPYILWWQIPNNSCDKANIPPTKCGAFDENEKMNSI